MLYLFAAVFFVLIVMNLFMAVVLRQMTGAAGRQIEKDAVRLFSAYDKILEDRSRKLEELDLEILERMDELEAGKAAGQTIPVQVPVGEATLVTGKYRDASFADTYHQVKTQFAFSLAEAAGRVQNGAAGTGAKGETDTAGTGGTQTGAVLSGSPAKRLSALQEILDQISFDAQYELSTLPQEDQKQILEEVFSPEGRQLYQEFADAQGAWDVQSFLEWCRMERRSLDQSLTVRARQLPSDWDTAGENLQFETDDSICEGFQILQGNQLYDYSI